jgi:hypothetical protein
MSDTVYKASKTLNEFHHSDSFVRGIKGPIGSGKSVGMCFEIFMKACEQEHFEGVRYSRWVVVRNTYRELIDTTIKTWTDWFPKRMGTWSQMNLSHTIKQVLPDGTMVHLEVMFRALDKPDDVKKLLSLELTGGWVNEAKEMPLRIIEMLQGRVGRYPSKRQGGPSWWGVIMDTNPPDTDSWWYRVFEETKPSNWELFAQPSGTSDEAENVENLPAKYYENMVPGKDQEWINVYVHGKYGFIQEGNPVYPEYNDDVHFSHHIVEPPAECTIHIGIDFGLTPAAAFAFEDKGQWVFCDEVVTRDMGALRFGEVLGKHIRSIYRDHPLIITGDPAGEQRAQTDEQTPFDILSALGIEADPAHTNDVVIRRETFAKSLTRMTFQGKPGLIVGPNCPYLRRGLAGGYKYRRMQVSGADKYVDKPDKNIYSHVCDAAQYLMLGAGEDDAIVGIDPDKYKLDYSELNRAAS